MYLLRLKFAPHIPRIRREMERAVIGLNPVAGEKFR